MSDTQTNSPQVERPKRHGHGTVGVGLPKLPPDPARLIQRRARLLDGLKRAEGPRKASLQAEVDSIDAELKALREALDAALAPPKAK